MAENEAKARKKLEEAEKKAKGGSGFLSGLFGSGKAEEAADLFVQEHFSDPEPVLRCEEIGCGLSFDDLVSYEDHYELFHRHQCAICGRQFPSLHCLEIHLDENHCSIFKLKRDRDVRGALFRCYEASCSQTYSNSEERNRHSKETHGITDLSMSLEKRKLPQKEASLSAPVKKSTSSISISRSPRAVVFGDEQKEPMFESIKGRFCSEWRTNGKKILLDSFQRSSGDS